MEIAYEQYANTSKHVNSFLLKVSKTSVRIRLGPLKNKYSHEERVMKVIIWKNAIELRNR